MKKEEEGRNCGYLYLENLQYSEGSWEEHSQEQVYNQKVPCFEAYHIERWRKDTSSKEESDTC